MRKHVEDHVTNADRLAKDGRRQGWHAGGVGRCPHQGFGRVRPTPMRLEDDAHRSAAGKPQVSGSELHAEGPPKKGRPRGENKTGAHRTNRDVSQALDEGGGPPRDEAGERSTGTGEGGPGA